MPIAKGCYTHYENSFPNGIQETWTQHNTAIDITFSTPTYELTAQMSFNEQNHISTFVYHLTDNSLSGEYRVQGNHLVAMRKLPSNTQLEDKLVFPENAILDLPFLSTKGHTILHINQHGTVPVFAPHLRSGDRAGDLAKKSVQKLGNETVIIGEKQYQATKYRYGHLYWIDEHGIVLKVEAEQYEMVLTEYRYFDAEF